MVTLRRTALVKPSWNLKDWAARNPGRSKQLCGNNSGGAEINFQVIFLHFLLWSELFITSSRPQEFPIAINEDLYAIPNT